MKKLVFFSLIISRFITRYFKKLSSRQRGANFTVVKQNQAKSPALKLKNLQQPLLLFFGGALVLFLIWFFRDNLMPKPVVSEGIIGLYTEDNLPPTVTSLLSRPLVNLNQSGQPVPDLAEKWQSTDEAKLYTLTLKPNLFWNDQTPLKSSDIKFNLEDIQVSYPDDQTIIFKLTDSFNPFPVLLNDPVFKQGSLVGDGLYNVSSIEKNKSVITKMVLMPANKNSNLPEINIRFYPDEQTAKTSFALGEINSLLGVSDTGDLVDQPAILINQVQIYNKLVAIFYNTKDPILSDKNLRKALNCVAPNVTDEERIQSPIPKTSWAFSDETKGCIDDLAQAKSYFAKVQNGKDSTITLVTTPNLSAVGEQVVTAWKSLGMNTVLRVESGIPQNFQALLIAQTVPKDPDQYALWHSTQTTTNLSQLKSDRIDKDLEDGRKTTDNQVRKDRYADFQKLLIEDPPATFLYFDKMNIVYRQNIANQLKKVINYQIYEE